MTYYGVPLDQTQSGYPLALQSEIPLALHWPYLLPALALSFNAPSYRSGNLRLLRSPERETPKLSHLAINPMREGIYLQLDPKLIAT